jgi:hypothetical protein
MQPKYPPTRSSVPTRRLPYDPVLAGRRAGSLKARRLGASTLPIVAESIRPEPDGLPEVAQLPAAGEHPFAAVRSRRAVDEMMRSMQDALVVYTGQADLKANIVITTSSLVLTISATRWNQASLRPGLVTVAIFTLCALLAAITVVIPKFRLPRKGDTRQHFEEHENPLFFGHFASMPKERWVETLAGIATEDAVLYEAQAADIHDQGRYLVEKKYKHLRLAYICLALAFVAGALVQFVATIV